MTKVCWVMFQKNGEIEKEIAKIYAIPNVGDGVFLNGKGFEVFGIVDTPHLDCKYHILVKEV